MATINYSQRDFASLKQSQINYIKQYYPGIVQNYNDASILSVFLDLNAAIADNLQFHIDRSLQETVLDYAQERQSLFNIAKTYGLKLPSSSASVAVATVSIQVPVRGDAEDKRYLPLLYAGSQFLSDDQTFELLYDVDFSSNFNISNNVDRTKIPVYVNGILSAYTITKTAILIAGTTKIYTQVIRNTQPFYQIILPENNVLSIESIIHKNGVNYQTLPTLTEFNSGTNKWYEVNSLAEDNVFVENSDSIPDANGVYPGNYIKIDRRFIREYAPNGFCTLTFGSQVNQGYDILDTFATAGIFDLKAFINNDSLGWAPLNNTTMYIKYRVGGGNNTNVGVGTINTVGQIAMRITGPNQQTNAIVEGSLTVTNVTPAIGGSDAPPIEELRNYIAYNFASQNRGVTLNDYKSLIMSMPAKYGVPSKVAVTESENKINVSVLTNDANGMATEMVSSVILENLANYLSRYRMINDTVVTKPAQVINIGFEISVLVQPGVQVSAISNIVTAVKSEFVQTNQQLGQSYLIGTLIKKITQIPGLLNVNYIKAFNKVGGEYSLSSLDNSQILNSKTNEIDLSNGAINVSAEQLLQIKYPENDITIIPVTQKVTGF
jgi:hypothetical protein